MNHDALGLGVPPQFSQPTRHFLEGCFIRDVVAEDAGVRAAVVEPADAAEALLACCVPDLEADGCVGGSVKDALGEEGGTDGGGGGEGRERVVDVAVYEGGFADAYRRRGGSVG
jgi:hypothetical protein